jgi:phytoene/squalene synthetase
MGWFRQLLSRRRVYDELSAEIREHLKEKIEELVAGGMSRKDASVAARREFGNLTLIEEDSRAALWVLVEIYSRLLKKITDRNYDVLTERVRLTFWEKLKVLSRGFLHRIA